MASHSSILAEEIPCPWGPKSVGRDLVTKQQRQPILIPLEKRGGKKKQQLSNLCIIVEIKMQPTSTALSSL